LARSARAGPRASPCAAGRAEGVRSGSDPLGSLCDLAQPEHVVRHASCSPWTSLRAIGRTGPTTRRRRPPGLAPATRVGERMLRREHTPTP
jgi:hypothetical protein